MRPLARVAFLLIPTILNAQGQERSGIDFSGVVFGNFQWRTDSAAKVPTGGKPASRFDVGRAYLTFRMPAGDRAAVRITTDIFQNTATGYYSGWAVRLKYGYLQYDLSRDLAGIDGLAAQARIGMLHTVVIDHVETFWPRWMGNSALEQHGFFSSADVGAATHLTLPNRLGEAYVTITNGPGYTAAENDRFKDFAARASFTPFARDSGMLRTLAITPWYYKGWSASTFVGGGAGQTGPVSEGLQKDRRGLFAGIRDRRLTLGAEVAQRLEEIESGANTAAAPRTVVTRTSTLTSVFALARPAELGGRSSRRASPLSLIARLDVFKVDRTAPPENRFLVLGAIWDLSPRTSLAFDYQEFAPRGGSASTPTRTWFLHWTAYF